MGLPIGCFIELMLAMFHYDVWQKSGAELGFVDFRESVKNIKENPVMAAEMLEVTDYLMSIRLLPCTRIML